MYNRRSNLNTDNNRIAIVNAYIENANHNRSIMQQIMELMTNQESMLRELVQSGIMLNENNNETIRPSSRVNTTSNNRRYVNNNLTRRRSNSETYDIFNSSNNLSQRQRPNSQRSSHSFNAPHNQPEERLANMLVSMMIPPFVGQTNGLSEDFLRPIVVRPTREQINRATEIVRYGDILNPPNSTCPIVLNNFRENDSVTRIKYCGHVFSENSLEVWFRENVRCPMCRYDIRNYNGSDIGGEIRRDINTLNINTDNNDDTNMTSLLDNSENVTREESIENDSDDQNDSDNQNNSNNQNNNSRQSPITNPFPTNAFSGLFTSSLHSGNDISNILNTFMNDLQNDPFFSAFPNQSRNGHFDSSGNYIFQTHIPINFNRVNSDISNNNN